MKKIYILLALFAVSCARSGKELELSDDPKEAARQIQTLIPLGTPTAAAKRLMEEQHFTCSVSKGDFQDLKGIDYIYCDKQGSRIVKRRWQAALVLAEDKVSAIRVGVGSIGP